MRITVAQRYLPFSHEPGVKCVLPGTVLRLHIFPALLRVESLLKAHSPFVEEIVIPVKGPVENFTVLQNLERGGVDVFGHAKSGYFRYRIAAIGEHSFSLHVEKGDFKFSYSDEPVALPGTIHERLSLGIDKKLDWDLVKRRRELSEIFPLWLRTGQMTPPVHIGYEGTGLFLKACEQSIDEGNAEEALESLEKLFLTGFEGILSPRLYDSLHLGFDLPPALDDIAGPLGILTQGAALIRSLFFRQRGAVLSILPHLPRLFHAGRYIHLKCEELGRLDMEWRSRKLRRLIFHSQTVNSIEWHFPKGISRCRLRYSENEPGKRLLNGDSVDMTIGDRLLFDHFE